MMSGNRLLAGMMIHRDRIMIHHDFACKDDFARLSVVPAGASGYHAPAQTAPTKEEDMRKPHHAGWIWTALLGAALLAPALCLADHPPAEVQLDAGYIMPRGDLNDDFTGTAQGFGADPGYEVGILWRYYLDERWSVAAAFHFAKFSEFEGTDEILGDYSVAATGYRYGLQLRRSFGNPDGWQPFLLAGAGVFRNRFEGRDKVLLEPFDRSLSTLGYSFGAGIRRGDVEIGAAWQINRFTSWRFFATDSAQDYDWDTLCLRFSWLIPRRQ